MRVFITLLVCSLTFQLFAEDHRIFVIGEAELEAPNSKTTIAVTIVSESEQLETALKQSISSREAVVTKLLEKGFPEQSIVGNSENTIPYMRRFTGKSKSYTIIKELNIEIKNHDELLYMAKLIDSYENLNFISINTSVAKEDSIKSELIVQAIAQGKAKIQKIENETGLTYTLVAVHPDFNPKPHMEKSALQNGFALFDAESGYNDNSLSKVKGYADNTLKLAIGANNLKIYKKVVYLEYQVTSNKE